MRAATVRRSLALIVAVLVVLNIGGAVALVDRAQHADEAPAVLVATTCPDVCRPATELVAGASCFLEWADYAPWWGWAPVCTDRAAVDAGGIPTRDDPNTGRTGPPWVDTAKLPPPANTPRKAQP